MIVLKIPSLLLNVIHIYQTAWFLTFRNIFSQTVTEALTKGANYQGSRFKKKKKEAAGYGDMCIINHFKCSHNKGLIGLYVEFSSTN